MADAVLLFTFGPVQGFIAEARRTADLFAGSHILVDLAKAAAKRIQQEAGDSALIFPSQLTTGMPNKLVARVPAERAEEIARAAEAALKARWNEISEEARGTLANYRPQPTPEADWHVIWKRQTEDFWEVFWAVAPMAGAGDTGSAYGRAYKDAQQALDAGKRTRAFDQNEEPGRKDSLSGRRQALHVDRRGKRMRADGTEAAGEPDVDEATHYWSRVAALNRGVSGAKLRPEGQERLDAIGAVKRFGKEGATPFPSTSTVAIRSYLEERARTPARDQLAAYKGAVERLLSGRLQRVSNDPDWPYDGDLLYKETLEPARLKSSYGLDPPDEAARADALKKLKALHTQTGGAPSPYYAVLALDGDGMGEAISAMLKHDDAEAAHRDLSERLATFAEEVDRLQMSHRATVVYNGGDDVLALVPLDQALPFARALASSFSTLVSAPGYPVTASAGIAIAHHNSPLGTALRAARDAESKAKGVEVAWSQLVAVGVPAPPAENGRTPEKRKKNAVCVMALKRSGETVQVHAPWEALTDTGDPFGELVAALGGEDRDGPLATRIVSTLAASARAFPDIDAPFRSELGRLLTRRTGSDLRSDTPVTTAPEPTDGPAVTAKPGSDAWAKHWAKRLVRWGELLPEEDARDALERQARTRPEHLADWVGLAAFVARGGGD